MKNSALHWTPCAFRAKATQAVVLCYKSHRDRTDVCIKAGNRSHQEVEIPKVISMMKKRWEYLLLHRYRTSWLIGILIFCVKLPGLRESLYTRDIFNRFRPIFIPSASSIDILFALLFGLAFIMSLKSFSYSEFKELSIFKRMIYSISHFPSWHAYTSALSQLWFWSELIVLMFNKRRRAIHDFIAGTIVVEKQ